MGSVLLLCEGAVQLLVLLGVGGVGLVQYVGIQVLGGAAARNLDLLLRHIIFLHMFKLRICLRCSCLSDEYKKGQFKLRSKVNHLLTAAGCRALPDPAAVQPLRLVATLDHLCCPAVSIGSLGRLDWCLVIWV